MTKEELDRFREGDRIDRNIQDYKQEIDLIQEGLQNGFVRRLILEFNVDRRERIIMSSDFDFIRLTAENYLSHMKEMVKQLEEEFKKL